MGLFSRPGKSGSDPTRDWPDAAGPAPQVNLQRRTLETSNSTLEFGAPLSAAEFLGRPAKFEMHREGNYTVTYAAWGLVLEFEENRFVQSSFLIGEDERQGQGSDLVLAQPRGPGGLLLTAQSRAPELVQVFGPPTDVQELTGETILYYESDLLCSELHLDEAGRLTRWELYLN